MALDHFPIKIKSDWYRMLRKIPSILNMRTYSSRQECFE